MSAADDFAEQEGRRPRILVVDLGKGGDGQGRGLATAFADAGFDVDVGPSSQTPEEAARQAIENDVHVVGISAEPTDYETIAPALIQALNDQGGGDILVIRGGNLDSSAAETIDMIRDHRATS